MRALIEYCKSSKCKFFSPEREISALMNTYPFCRFNLCIAIMYMNATSCAYTKEMKAFNLLKGRPNGE